MRAASSSMRRIALSISARLARGAHAEQLGVAADRGQRRAQLVRGVGEEAAQAVLARLLPGERVLEPVEHRVEREPQPADLGARVGGLDAAGRGRRRRSRRPCGPMRSSGQQAEADDRPGDAAEHEQHRGDDQRLDGQQAVQRRVDLAERQRRRPSTSPPRGVVGVHPVAQFSSPFSPVTVKTLAQRHVARELGRRRRCLAVGEHVLTPIAVPDASRSSPYVPGGRSTGSGRRAARRGPSSPGERRRGLRARRPARSATRSTSGSAPRTWSSSAREQERALLDVGDRRRAASSPTPASASSAASSRARSEAITCAAAAARSRRRGPSGSATGRARRASCAGS